MDLGSCREVIQDGVTGILVKNVEEAVQALPRLAAIDPAICREHVRRHFSIASMVDGYERVYHRIFDLETQRPS
jgi:glycosyltransferase involved in cell wall biosynthesis